ncbi:MAG TPA: 50S ribosomal protein L4 [Candidatus Omnitrophota bacterium]|nr:50S ribosomal protein L4 [Candidatus Omnitrophota bacterium]HOX09805.1 50S ribosomal protein L4 [Candidatus Omnitrophota bacterium]
MSELAIYNIKGQSVGKVELDKKVFNGEVNEAILHQVIRMYEANQRQGTADTKTRSEVHGGGKKPWKQKGTGRARAGTSRSPLWKGGGKIFGPHPRDYSYSVPKSVKRLALISSLNAKVNDNDMIVLDDLKLEKPKTKEFAAMLGKIKAEQKPMIVLESKDQAVVRASRNIGNLLLRDYKALNAYEVLKQKKVVITHKALEALTKQLVKQ